MQLLVSEPQQCVTSCGFDGVSLVSIFRRQGHAAAMAQKRSPVPGALEGPFPNTDPLQLSAVSTAGKARLVTGTLSEGHRALFLFLQGWL